ncbi:MAG: hypothetical protein QW607_11435 [Desulfurococcaceae archaeon]
METKERALSRFKHITSLIALLLPILLVTLKVVGEEALLRMITPNTLYVLLLTSIFLALSSLVYFHVKDEDLRKDSLIQGNNFKESIDLSYLYFIIVLSIFAVISSHAIINSTRYPLLISYPIITLFSLVLVLLEKIRRDVCLTIILAHSLILIAFTCLLYVSPFGYDTWRDIIWGELISRGFNTYHHAAYPIPLVPLLYSVISEIIGLSVLKSSVIIGFTYIILMTLLVYNVAKFYSKNKFIHLISALLIFSNAPITLLSVWFVPQAYSTTFAIIIVTFIIRYLRANSQMKSDMIPLLLAIIATVIGHSLTALLTLVLISYIMLIYKLRSYKSSGVLHSHLKTISLILAITLITYVVFTTVTDMLKTGAFNAWNVLTNILLGYGYRDEFTSEGGDPLLSALLGYGPLAICLALSFLAWIEESGSMDRDKFIEASFPISMGVLALSLLSIHTPFLFPSRYYVLMPTTLLIITSVKGLNHLHTKGNVGRIVLALYLVLILSSIPFGIVHIGDELPVNIKTAFTISAPLRSNEILSLNEALPKIEIRTVCTDSRSSLWILWYYIRNLRIISIDSQTRPSKVSLITEFKHLDLIQLGSYETRLVNDNEGNIVITSSHVITQLQGLYIHRPGSSALGTLGVNLSEENLLKYLYDRFQKVHDGPIEFYLVNQVNR